MRHLLFNVSKVEWSHLQVYHLFRFWVLIHFLILWVILVSRILRVIVHLNIFILLKRRLSHHFCWLRLGLVCLNGLWASGAEVGDLLIVSESLFEVQVIVAFDLAISVIPLVTAVALNPLFSVVSTLVLIFIEINLLAVVAVLLGIVSKGADIAQPGVLVSMKLSSGPEFLGFITCFNILLRTNDVLAYSRLLSWSI